MMKIFSGKLLISFGLLLLMAGPILAQTKENPNPYADLPFKERLFFGGDLGFNASQNFLFVRIAPMVGFNVSPKFSVGAGPSYQFWRDRRYTPDLETSIYGGSVFGRYFVFESFFLQSEFELLNLEEIAFDLNTADFIRQRVNVPILLVGGGYSQRTANGSGFFVGAFYDVIQDINSPYPNNIAIRVGGMIGL